MFISLILLFGGLGRYIHSQEKKALRLKTDLTSEQVAIRLETYVGDRIKLVQSMQELWSLGEINSEKQFRAYSLTQQAQYKGMIAISRADSDKVIRWIVPVKGNEAAKDKDLKTHPVAGPIIDEAGITGKLQLSPPLELYQGGLGIVSYLSLEFEGKKQGFLNTVFRVSFMIDECLEAGVKSNFMFKISDADSVIYSYGDFDELSGDEVSSERTFSVGNREWTILLRPRESVIKQSYSEAPKIISMIGILLGVVLSALSFQIIVSRESLELSSVQLRNLSERLENIREEERKRISREIHDDLGQKLTALKMEVAWLYQKYGEEVRSTDLEDQSERTTKLIDTTIASVRRIAQELRPRVLDDLGLIAALESELKLFEERTKISCQLIQPYGDIILPPKRATAAYRIFQEALTNVARHSNAKKVVVSVTINDDILNIGVSDNGIGMVTSEPGELDSLGVLGMTERARLHGGKITINSVKGAGTTVQFTVPLS